jgi:hypothetical protein
MNQEPDPAADNSSESDRSQSRRVIRMFPDWGHDWPLWETEHDNYLMEPPDYGLSADLTAKILGWHREWENGFDMNTEPPSWKPGRGTLWSERGREIADLLREEVRSFADVEYDGRPY